MNSAILLVFVDVRRFVDADSGLAEQTSQFIQENMTSIKDSKSFLSLPQINIKLLGRYSLANCIQG